VSFPFPLAGIMIAAAAALMAYALIALAIGPLRRHAEAEVTERSSHSVATPQGAGAVIVPVALAFAALAFMASGQTPAGGMVYAGVVAGLALALMAVGFVDDMRSLDVVPRLVSQALTVGIAVALLPEDVRVLPAGIPVAVERLALFIGVLWFVNLYNFMDGIDLMSVVETVAITLGIALLALFDTVPVTYGYVAVALLGATLGFAPWNAPPARLFLGDAGSLPIGFLLAILLIHVAAANAAAAAVILPLYYLADATLTLLRRLARGERVWRAHREHFYQQALRNGFTVTQIVGRIAVLDAVLIALALGAALHGTSWAGVALLIATIAVGLTLRTFAKGPP
jgi:UDP-N-acetylmuramyl pentapeptide phosphotransferase/UDP-N-acetylglucosamine-1-phosphate transferase